MSVEIFALSERSLVVQFGHDISLKTNYKVKQLFYYLKKQQPSWLIDSIPAYNSLTVEFDPFQVSFNGLQNELQNKVLETMPVPERIDIKIPVCYDLSFGIDLERVALYNRCSIDDVIRIHSQRVYPVFMIGFTPGFPYLGLVAERISTPRQDAPRLKVSAGSVGIAERQTGIYPQEGPGGWNIIGRVPISIFDEDKGALIQLNHWIRFEPITRTEFETILKNPNRWQMEW